MWFDPGEPLDVDVPNVDTPTLKGQWLDQMPLGTLQPGPNELRLESPLMLKDKRGGCRPVKRNRRRPLGRITFKEDGYSWELISGVPVCRSYRGYPPQPKSTNELTCSPESAQS